MPVFQLDQLFGQLLENLAGLDQKVLENLFIRIETHAPTPLGRVIGRPRNAALNFHLGAAQSLNVAARQRP